MKKFSKILLSLICLLGFTASVNAASYSSSISASKTGTTYEYVNGLEISYNKASSYDLYALSQGTYFGSKTTLSNPVEADAGFTYIINNSKVTSSSTKNYYIAQAAVLWYQDYLTNSDANISNTLKNYIINNANTDTVCYYIYKLVNDAKKYSSYASSIVFEDKTITFSKEGDYYYSNIIDVTTYDLRSKPSVKFYNAPKSTTVTNNTLVADGEGSFQIRIPESSLESFTRDDFEVSITGSSYQYTTVIYNNGYDYAIYGRVYSTTNSNIEASLPVMISNVADTKVRIKIVDYNGKYISGLRFNIYSGDCSESTCSNLVNSYTTTSTYTSLNGVLIPGTYTLVIPNYSRYNLPQKKVFTVKNNNTSLQLLTIEGSEYDDNDYYPDDDNDYSDELTRVRIYNNINNSSDYIKVYSTYGILIKSYSSTNANYYLNLAEGSYYIIDSNKTIDKIYFNITSNGKIEVNGKTVSYINVIKNNSSSDNDYYPNDNDYYPDNNDNDYDNNSSNQNNGSNDNVFNEHYDYGDFSVDIETSVDTNTNVSVDVNGCDDCDSTVVDVPITNLSSTLKYILGAIVLSAGLYLVIRNVKKSKNNC